MRGQVGIQTTIGVLLILLSVLPPSAAAQAAVGHAFHVDIPALPLGDALRTLADEGDFQIVFMADVARGHLAPRLEGQMSVEQALEALLAHTELEYVRVGDAYVIRPRKGTQATQMSSSPETGSSGPAEQGIGHSGTAPRVSESSESQETPPQQSERKRPAARSDTKEPLVLEEIVITGTHIRGISPESSPLTVYTRQDIQQTGASTVAQLARKMPQNFALVDTDTAHNSGFNVQASANRFFGTGVNLHGLGSGSTLVLLNGHRLAPTGTDGSFVDVSMIPLSAIERVEVLTDGASAIYGADAVAGVVNFVLRRDFEGAETSLRYGATTRGGADERDASQLFGKSWDSGNLTVVYDYHGQDPLRADQRNFIPDQGGQFFVFPQEKRHSAFLSARQRLSAMTDIFADAFYSTRSSAQDLNNAFLREHTAGGADQYAVALGIGHELPAQWRVDLVGNYFKTTGRNVDSFPDFPPSLLPPTIFATRSELESADLQADGPMFTAPGGSARASFGSGVRREKFADLSTVAAGTGAAGTGLHRTVFDLYGEIFVPVIGDTNARAWAERLEASLAVRYEDYGRFGSSTNPKVGLLWSPLPGIKIRATYGTSFRAPPLANLSDTARVYAVLPLPDPTSPSGITNTIFFTGGNSSLKPERSRSFTFGVDLTPTPLPQLSTSATYFHIHYTDRIAFPPLIGGTFNLYSQADALAPFITRSPDPAAVQQFYNNPFLINPFNIPATAIQALFDSLYHNISTTNASGIDFSVRYGMSFGAVRIEPFLNLTYLLQLDDRPSSLTPVVARIDTIYNPIGVKLRGGLNGSYRAIGSSLTINHSAGYHNNLVTPATRVASWTTLDWQLSYGSSDRESSFAPRGLRIALDVQNLTDKSPPFVTAPASLGVATLGYDATNASPLGRRVAVSVTKRW